MTLMDLLIKITMKDETSKPLKDVEDNTEKVEKKAKGLGQTVDKWITRGLGLIGGKALLDMGKKSVMLASDINECDNVINTTFGDGNATISKFTSECGKNFGMSTLDAKKFTGSLGAMLKSSGVTGKGLEDMTTSLVGLSGDFASFYNLGHEEAFEKIRSGISGETEPLKSLGINMSVANLEAYALSKGITKKFQAMSQGEQVQLRYNYLMNVSKDAQGDFKDTSNQFANQLRILQLQIQENSRALGEKLLPYVTKLVTWVNNNINAIKTWGTVLGVTLGIIVAYRVINSVVTAIQNWRKVTQGFTVVQALCNAVLALNPVTLVVMGIMALVVALVVAYNKCETFRNIVNTCWNVIKNVTMVCWGAIVTFFTTTIPNAFNSVMTFFQPMVDGIVACWQTFVDYFMGAWNFLDGFFTVSVPQFCNNFVNWFKDIPNKISNLWENIKQFFVNGWNSIVNFFTVSVPQFVSNFISFLGTLPYKVGFIIGFVVGKFALLVFNIGKFFLVTIPSLIGQGIGFIIGKMAQFGVSIINGLIQLPSMIWNVLVMAYNKVVTWGSNLISWVMVTIPKIINSIITFFRELPIKIWTWLVNTYNKVVTWGSNMVNKAKEVGSRFIQSAISFFKNLPNAIWTWLVSTFTKVTQWASNMINKARDMGSRFVQSAVQFIQNLPSNIWTWLSNTISKVTQWASDMVSKGRDAMVRFGQACMDGIRDLPSKFMSIGGDIVRGVWNGITSMGSWIKDKVGSFFSGIVDGAKSALGIHSPSRVFRDEVGKFMAQGVGVGFEDEMLSVQKQVKGTLDTTVSPVDVNAINFNKDNSNNMMSHLCNLMQQLVDKDVIIKSEQGREVARLIAPYQKELKRYNNRNLSLSY